MKLKQEQISIIIFSFLCVLLNEWQRICMFSTGDIFIIYTTTNLMYL